MKAPSSPARFHTSVRHYHRSRTPHTGDWNEWIGDEPKPASSFRKPLLVLLALVVTFAVGVGIYYAI